MQKRTGPDVAVDECPRCGGTFLDHGELNTLATGMAGNIEYCSVDEEFHADRFPARGCPKCDGVDMRKVNLLRFSDLVIDFCPSCEGFFLDRGEIARMNTELREAAPSGEAEELREFRDGRLVRVDRVAEVVRFDVLGVEGALPATYLRIQVFFKQPAGKGLRIVREKWTAKLGKLFGLLHAEDIATGHAEFDSRFLVRSDTGLKVRDHLSDAFMDGMVEFVESEPRVLSRPGVLQVVETGLVYFEGPYLSGTLDDALEKAEPVIAGLLKLAALFEGEAG
jgi:Zn-finger nucleic acid-binding protein